MPASGLRLAAARNGRAIGTPPRAALGMLQGVVGRGLGFALAYLATIVLARRLGPADYGTYGVIVSVLIWIEQTARCTVPQATAKLIPENADRSASVQQTALFVGALLFFLLFALLCFAATPLVNLFGLGPGGARLLRIAAMDLPLFGLYAVYRGMLQGHRDFLSLSIADVLYAAAKLGGVLLLLGLWLSVASALMANVLASLAALLFVMSRTSVGIPRPSLSVVRPLVSLALPLGLYMLTLQTITNLDLWSLTALDSGSDPSTLGIYVAARTVAVVPGVVLMVVSDVLLPSLSRAQADNDVGLSQRYIQGAVRFICILIVPIALILVLAPHQIMALLYSGRFSPGGAFVPVLAVYAISLPFMDLFASALSARGEPYRGGVTLLCVIPFALVLNVVLITSLGAMGAAYASALAGLTGTVVLGSLVVKRFGPLMTGRSVLNTLLAVAAMILAAIPLQSTPALASVAGVSIYGVALVLLGELNRGVLGPLAFWKWRFR